MWKVRRKEGKFLVPVGFVLLEEVERVGIRAVYVKEKAFHQLHRRFVANCLGEPSKHRQEGHL